MDVDIGFRILVFPSGEFIGMEMYFLWAPLYYYSFPLFYRFLFSNSFMNSYFLFITFIPLVQFIFLSVDYFFHVLILQVRAVNVFHLSYDSRGVCISFGLSQGQLRLMQDIPLELVHSSLSFSFPSVSLLLAYISLFLDFLSLVISLFHFSFLNPNIYYVNYQQ